MAEPRDRLAGAGGILSYFTRHATAANIVLAVCVIAGLAALPRMRAQYFPDVVVPEVVVALVWEGAGAADVDRGMIDRLQPSLMAIEGVASVTSTAGDSGGDITLEFEPGWDLGRAVDEVEAAVAGVTDLPAQADTPTVTRRAWRDRVTDIVVTGPVETNQLIRIGDELIGRLYEAGVTRASYLRVGDPEIRVEVSMASLMRHDLTLREIADRIAAETGEDPAGVVGDGSARLRTGREKRLPAELAEMALRTRDDGTLLTLGEVAEITETSATGTHAYFVGDNPAVLLRAERSADGDAIGIQRTVEDVITALRPTLPAGVGIDLIRTRSEEITARLDILLQNGGMGLLLVVTLLFLFLNARTALWVAAGIPVAMLAAIAMMQAAGITLNMISLFALIITLGIVVDDAIVVGEHADFRFRRRGEAPVTAAETAVRRMAAPVLSSTVTTIIAFLGLTAISGRFGDMIADIPFTVSVVLLASLIECFLILPNHMAHALEKAGRGRWYDAPSRVVNRGLGWVRDRIVRPLTRLVIIARYPVLAGAIALLAWEVGLFLRGDVQWRFFNSPEQATVNVNFALVDGASLEDTRAVMRQVQAAVETVAAELRDTHGVEPLRYVVSETGANSWPPLPQASTKDKHLLGSVSIELVDPDLRSWTSFEFIAAVQKAAPTDPLIEELSLRGWRSGPGGDSLDVEFSGAEATTLKAAAEALKQALAPYPEVTALEDSLPYDKDELVLELTPQGRALGFTVEALGAELRARMNGTEATNFPDGNRSIAVNVELPEDERTADFLDRMLMRNAAGGYVPLSDIVTVSSESGFNEISRENGVRIVNVTGDLSEDDPARAEEILDALARTILPAISEDLGVAWRIAGLAEQEDEFLSDAMIGLYAALIGIYVVLAWIFSSWTRPVVVMAVIPLGLIGAIHGHYVWNVPMSMFSVVGMIGMAGIIVNDSIVLVSTADEYARDRAMIPAIVDAVADRLRPVLLTTLTTVLGLAPLLFETSRQAQFLKPTVITLCYGLGFGLVLVLLAVPALLAVQTDIRTAFRSLRRGMARGRLRPYLLAGAVLEALLFAWLIGPAAMAGQGIGVALGWFVLTSLATLILVGALASYRLGQSQPVQP